MTWKHATLPLGSALRIAPAFTATATADDISVETTISAVYAASAGRYRITATSQRAVGGDGEITSAVLRQVRLGEVLSAAVPLCVTVEFEGKQRSVQELLQQDGRVLPEWMATAAAKAGPSLRVTMLHGKFQGVIAATTPTGCFIVRIRESVRADGTTSP